MDKEFFKYSIRTDENDAHWIRSAYEAHRADCVQARLKPSSLNKFLISLIRESLASYELKRV